MNSFADSKQLTINAVGFQYRGRLPDDVRNGNLSLLPDPSNEYDANAIKLLSNEEHIAYISAKQCEQVHKYIKSNPNHSVQVIQIFPGSVQLLLESP